MLTGVDVHPEFQRGFNFDRAYAIGHRFGFIKATEGDKFVPPFLREMADAAARSRLVRGFYHFLDNTATGAEQAVHFIRTVKRVNGGNLAGVMLAVDYEGNGARTADDRHLRGFISALRIAVPKRPIIVYSGPAFWNGEAPGTTKSPPLSEFGDNLVRWDARYADMMQHMHPRQYHDSIRSWYLSQPGWGGQTAKFWQFTSAGLVDDMYVDVDAFYGDMDELQSIAGMFIDEERDEPDVGLTNLERDVEDAITFGRAMIGTPYGTGWAANTWPALSPLYAHITRNDKPAWYRARPCICSGFINVLRYEIAGLPAVGRAQGDGFPGGTAAIGRHLAFAPGSKPYPPVANTPRGWLVWSPYIGAPLALQGHVGIALGDGRVLEARVPALSANRTESEGSRGLVSAGGRPYERIIPPYLWLRK